MQGGIDQGSSEDDDVDDNMTEYGQNRELSTSALDFLNQGTRSRIDSKATVMHQDDIQSTNMGKSNMYQKSMHSRASHYQIVPQGTNDNKSARFDMDSDDGSEG